MQINQAMMFKPSDILIKFLTMFLTLDDLSGHLNNGSYEFMSRVRVGYIIKKTQKNVKNMTGAITGAMTGGDVNSDKDIDRYNEGLDILYKGGRRSKNMKTHRMQKHSFMKTKKLFNYRNINKMKTKKHKTGKHKTGMHKSRKNKHKKYNTRKYKTRKL